ncbi:MAG TPA: citrate synthase [Vicinamibacterales bacterium]|nr:citrate synthase [Vicinamibacterales bacterium]
MAETLSITDTRTGRTYELEVRDGAIRAADLRKIKTDDADFGLLTYDPALANTAAVRSRITFIDGDRGILRHRGYPIEQLAEQSTYLETAYLLLNGDLPTASQLDAWTRDVLANRVPPERLDRLFDGFAPEAHPMGIMIAAWGALSTYHPDARNVLDAGTRRRQVLRILAQAPTLAAAAARARRGLAPARPPESSSFIGGFLAMLFAEEGRPYKPHPVLERALDLLFILHADHEQNCSTFAMRSVGSSHADPYSACAAATAALFGPLHGGANEAVLKMLTEIGEVSHVPAFIERVKRGETRLMGFGHRVYKSYDPRAAIIKRTADEVFEVTGRSPLLEIAMELERIALQDDYFVSRRLYPNVDFYSGLIYQAMGFSTEMFPVVFAVARTAGWLAQWEEMMADPDTRIVRPRQLYEGPAKRDYVPMDRRGS